jgi:hypothetical protein
MGKDKWADVIEYLRNSNRDPKATLKLLKGNEKGHQSNYNINRSSYTLNVIAAITQKILDPKNKNKNITSIIRSWVITKDFEEFYNLLRRDEGKKYVRADAEYTKLYTKQLLDLWYSKTKEVLKWKRYFKKTKGYFIVNNPVEALDKTKGKSIISSSMTPKKNRS